MSPEKELSFEELPQVVILTGMSGAGRTEAMHIFEDLGFFCIDNLPASLIGELVKLPEFNSRSNIQKIAVVCDTRNGQYFAQLRSEIEDLRKKGIDYSIVYLDASDEKLIARYKSSRRRHPLCEDGTTIAQGIQKERELLFWLKENANHVIDTTNILPQNLRDKLTSLFSKEDPNQGLAITVFSFGFKHGAPVDADLVIDVRFLPNPFYDEKLKHLTGLDDAVKEYVLYRSETIEFENKWHALLDVLIPGYINEHKQQLCIAVGCTGGQHRSVVLAEATGDFLKSHGYRVSVAHRDLSLKNK